MEQLNRKNRKGLFEFLKKMDHEVKNVEKHYIARILIRLKVFTEIFLISKETDRTKDNTLSHSHNFMSLPQLLTRVIYGFSTSPYSFNN